MDSPAARLEVVAGKASGMSILVEDELLIGRQADGAGRLADDEEISRSHARVGFDNSGYCSIEDLGSTNGTYLNGLRITTPATLSEGDTIELGATTLVVRELPSPESAIVAPAPGAQMTVVPGAPRAAPPEPADDQPAPIPTSAPPPKLAVGVEVDFAAREARIVIGDEAETVRLELGDGGWRVVGP